MSYFKINLFDDGNNIHKSLPNIWELVESKYSGSKLVLRNCNKPEIIINTISAWKTSKIDLNAISHSDNPQI